MTIQGLHRARAVWFTALVGGQLVLAGCQRGSAPQPGVPTIDETPTGARAPIDARTSRASGDARAGGPATDARSASTGGGAVGRALWRMPNPPSTGLPNAQSYDSNPHIVVDRITGLVWQRKMGPDALLWNDANSYCADLVVAGADDWRLPTLIELTSLVDFTRVVPAIDRSAFPDPVQGNFWTSTPVAGSSGEAWYLAFSTGFNYQGHKDFLRIGARCVRSPALPRDNRRYTNVSAATVTDAQTTLTWQGTLDGATYSWTGAKAYCKSLKLAGAHWRLPSMKELQTLVDVGRTAPAIDATAFPASPMEQFWTSSELAGSSTDAWYVSFRLGAVNTIAKDSSGFARCVRGN